MHGQLRIGELARHSGLTERTLRHYEELGLLAPERASNGYRWYDAADVARLRAIAALKNLGLSLPQIKEALSSPDWDIGDVVDQQIELVTQQIERAQSVRDQLEQLRRRPNLSWNDAVSMIAVVEQLQHPIPTVRLGAALNYEHRAGTVQLVDRLVIEPDPAVREALTWAISNAGSEALPAIQQHLTTADAAGRQALSRVLGKLHNPQAVPLLIELLGDPDATVRRRASFELGQYDEPAAIHALVTQLGDQDEPLRTESAASLWRIRASAAPAIREVLATSANPLAREQAAELLGSIAEPIDLQLLQDALKDAASAVRIAAVLGLTEIGTPAAYSAIATAVDDDDDQVAALARRLSG